MGILDELKRRIVMFDGGMGSLLQERGLKPGELPELWNLTHPEEVSDIHSAYLEAGCDIILTNTFGANRLKYDGTRGPGVKEIVRAGTENAKRAVRAAGRGFTALDIGPTGKLLKPMGDLDFEEAVSVFAETVEAGAQAGADLIVIETMSDMYELKAAVLAAKEHAGLPIFATVIFDGSGKLLTGGTPEAVTAMLEGLGVDALGVNCGLGPVQMKPLAERLTACASIPVIVNPNAGLPRSDGERTVYDITPAEFAEVMDSILDLGVSAVGGCCGTTPEHMRLLRERVKDRPAPRIVRKNRTVAASYAAAVEFGREPVIIGERINPTGKPRLKKALIGHDLEFILREGIAQQENGAAILDVNAGLPEIDEASVMTELVTELQSVTELPLQLDTSDPKALAAALRVYNGKPLVNSVNGKREVMDAVFPLVRHYGGVLVALTLDEEGIPETANGRISIARRIYAEAERYGIGKEDILIDALCMTISSNPESALTVLETVRRVRTELGGRTILGVSNISFGLPLREHINAAFFTMALSAGLDAAIVNPNSREMMCSYHSFRALHALDPYCSDYIRIYGPEAAAKKKAGGPEAPLGIPASPEAGPSGTAAPSGPGLSSEDAKPFLAASVERGLKDQAARAAERLLKECPALEIIDSCMIPALDRVGKGFEAGTVFLPQLLMSAEAAKAAFAVIKESMEASGSQPGGRECVILATVKGDIHDIGKNIVKVLLENYSFQVTDLGKDVSPERIVEETVRGRVKLVGLSALMTTTVPAMAETIRLLRKEAPWAKVMVGGAVLTEEYAGTIGADAYCKDAMASVGYAKKVFGQMP
ncbi:homocysteine methyltransferase [Clostridiaceae bacterium]|nr:homocysteine methyltransferase [Clostridiaceae bacterium]